MTGLYNCSPVKCGREFGGGLPWCLAFVIFIVGLHFCQGSRQEHQDLTVSSDSELVQPKKHAESVMKGKQASCAYMQPETSECPVDILNLYLIKASTKPKAFFLQPFPLKYVKTYLFPIQVFIVFVLFFQAFKEWMTIMVHSLHTLAGKSSSNIEVAELQLAGCVLVTVLARLGWLDARRTWDKLGIDILIELMNLLKLPLTNPTLIQQWCTDIRGRITPEIRYAKSVEI